MRKSVHDPMGWESPTPEGEKKVPGDPAPSGVFLDKPHQQITFSPSSASRQMNAIEFREITLENLYEVVGLQVTPDQTELVADNLYSIAQAGLDPDGAAPKACRAGQWPHEISRSPVQSDTAPCPNADARTRRSISTMDKSR
jgi:hypothetical protein